MKKLLLTVAFCVVPHVVHAQPTHADVVKALDPWIAKEVALKRIPMLSIALVDDQKVVWSRTFDERGTQATAVAPVYRVGSVSKPFTALLLMMLVELGLIDLDAPVQQYLPDFNPTIRPGRRSRCAKCCRIAPASCARGQSAATSTTPATLAATVKGLNDTTLTSEPGTTTAYSNMALAVAGYVLERTQKQPFETMMRDKLLAPLGMSDSSFVLTPELAKRLPPAPMWTYHGREFSAPVWNVGTVPAGTARNADKGLRPWP